MLIGWVTLPVVHNFFQVDMGAGGVESLRGSRSDKSKEVWNIKVHTMKNSLIKARRRQRNKRQIATIIPRLASQKIHENPPNRRIGSFQRCTKSWVLERGEKRVKSKMSQWSNEYRRDRRVILENDEVMGLGMMLTACVRSSRRPRVRAGRSVGWQRFLVITKASASYPLVDVS